MGAMFLGGAVGSAAAMTAWKAGGWDAVAALGGAFALVAVALQIASLRRKH
jgi:hypothetical protein